MLSQGTANERITLTKNGGGSVTDRPPDWPQEIRLANGSDILEGVIQIKYRGVWKGICANSAKYVVRLLSEWSNHRVVLPSYSSQDNFLALPKVGMEVPFTLLLNLHNKCVFAFY